MAGTNAVADSRIDECENCDGLTVIYDGLVIGTEEGEIRLDGEVCMDGCDPLLTSVTVHS